MGNVSGGIANNAKNEVNYNEILSSLSQEETNLLIKAGVRSSIVCGYDWGSLIYFSYRLVKDKIPTLLNEGKIVDIISLGLEEKNVPFTGLKPNELVSFVLWIREELEEIAKMESDNLSKPPKPEMVAAGIDRFDKYGTLNVIYSLCEKYGWTMDYVWNLTYEEVFNLQMYSKESGEFNEALNNIYKKKK